MYNFHTVRNHRLLKNHCGGNLLLSKSPCFRKFIMKSQTWCAQSNSPLSFCEKQTCTKASSDWQPPAKLTHFYRTNKQCGWFVALVDFLNSLICCLDWMWSAQRCTARKVFLVCLLAFSSPSNMMFSRNVWFVYLFVCL